MAGHVYSEIFLHFNWHTLGDAPMLVPATELFVHNYIRNRCRQTKGVFFHEIGGTETHVHLVIRIEPFVLISDLLGELKGGSSHETNKHAGRKLLDWQRGYGVVSFGKRQLPWVIEYVRNQKQHHAKGTAIPRLEATGDEMESQAEACSAGNLSSIAPPAKAGGKQPLEPG